MIKIIFTWIAFACWPQTIALVFFSNNDLIVVVVVVVVVNNSVCFEFCVINDAWLMLLSLFIMTEEGFRVDDEFSYDLN